MKVVAYGIRPSEKGMLANANHKKHDITLITNPLTTETAFYAKGKEVVILFTETNVFSQILEVLAKLGIRYIITRCVSLDPNVPKSGTLDPYGILWASVGFPSPLSQVLSIEYQQQMANQTIHQLDTWQLPS